MKITFNNFCDKTPFKVMTTGCLGPKVPAFWFNPSAAFNPKTKSAAIGVVFTSKNALIEVVCRLITQAVFAWPDSKKVFVEYLGGLNELKISEGER